MTRPGSTFHSLAEPQGPVADDDVATIAEAIRGDHDIFANLCTSMGDVLPCNLDQALTDLIGERSAPCDGLRARQIAWLNLSPSPDPRERARRDGIDDRMRPDPIPISVLMPQSRAVPATAVPCASCLQIAARYDFGGVLRCLVPELGARANRETRGHPHRGSRPQDQQVDDKAANPVE